MDNMSKAPSQSTQDQGPSSYDHVRLEEKLENMPLLIGEIAQTNCVDELTKITHIEWKILKHSSCFFSKMLKSPTFTFANASWNIHLINKLLMGVRLENETKIDSEIIFSFGIKKLDGSSETRINLTPFKANAKCFYPYICKNSMEETTLGYMHNDTFTVICDIKCIVTRGSKCLKRKRIQTAENMNLAGLEILSRNLKDLLVNKEDCDAALIVQGKEFKAHRYILTARSSVFAAMFRHDTAERRTGEVIITDCDSNYFQEFLEYLYCGRLEAISSENAFPLYEAANKYNIQDLKELCINYLMENLTVQNICNIFTFAEEHDETDLFKSARTFFKKHFEEISNAPEWDDLLKNNLPLVAKLLKK